MDYNYLKSLVPKDKYDTESIPKLMELSEEDIQPILPELFFWVGDINLPVAPDMITVISRFPNSLLPLIKEKLQPLSKDNVFKYFIITELIPVLPSHVQLELWPDISRIINNPTDNEKFSALNAAKRYSEKLKKQ